jgi:hypothetical protein
LPAPNFFSSCAWIGLMPSTSLLNEPVARNDSDLESREAGRLLGLPERLGRGDLHRLGARDRLPEAVAHAELQQGHREGDDQRECRGLAKQLDVAPPENVPAGDAEDDERSGGEPGEQDVQVGAQGELVAEQRPDVGQLGLPARDLVAHGVLHPRVGHEDEVR